MGEEQFVDETRSLTQPTQPGDLALAVIPEETTLARTAEKRENRRDKGKNNHEEKKRNRMPGMRAGIDLNTLANSAVFTSHSNCCALFTLTRW